MVKAAVAGLGVAIATAILWRFFPSWQFYLSLLLGFGVAETIARFSGNKRGADLQVLALGIITVGFVLSRVLLAQRFGISWSEVNALDQAVITPETVQEFGRRAVPVSEILQLDLVPDLVYVLIAYVIGWIRFR